MSAFLSYFRLMPAVLLSLPPFFFQAIRPPFHRRDRAFQTEEEEENRKAFLKSLLQKKHSKFPKEFNLERGKSRGKGGHNEGGRRALNGILIEHHQQL